MTDFSKGQAFECFHCYKQAHIIVHIVYSLFLFISTSVLVYCIFLMYVFFSFDATILVNKDV